MPNYLLYAPEGSDTGKALVDELKTLGIDINGGSNPPTSRVDILIRYGSRVPIPKGLARKVINPASSLASAANKLQTLTTLKESGLHLQQPNVWSPNSPDLVFPVLGRRIEHSKGTDVQFVNSRFDLKWAATHDPKSEYFVELLPVETEWRIHVVAGQRIRTSIKYLADESLRNVNPLVRNVASGWKFRHPESHEKPPALLSMAAKYAVDMLGLDFGAVDCARLDTGRGCIFEVNTAAGLVTSQQGPQLYAKAFKREYFS